MNFRQDYHKKREEKIQQHSETALLLISQQVDFVRDLSVEVFASSKIGGCFSAKSSHCVDVWLDFDQVLDAAGLAGMSAPAAMECALLHELGHFDTRDEKRAWDNAVKIWRSLPVRASAIADLDNMRSLMLWSYGLHPWQSPQSPTLTGQKLRQHLAEVRLKFQEAELAKHRAAAAQANLRACELKARIAALDAKQSAALQNHQPAPKRHRPKPTIFILGESAQSHQQLIFG